MWNPKIPTHHIVIDIETLGIEHDAQIVEIGACCIYRGECISTFARVIDLKGRIFVNAETLKWWDTMELSSVLKDSGRKDAKEVLKDLSAYIGQYPDAVVVGNGSTFDITILESAYKKEYLPFPVPFRMYRDLRTYVELYERDTNEEMKKEETKHRALHDAMAEGRTLIKILNRFAPRATSNVN